MSHPYVSCRPAPPRRALVALALLIVLPLGAVAAFAADEPAAAAANATPPPAAAAASATPPPPAAAANASPPPPGSAANAATPSQPAAAAPASAPAPASSDPAAPQGGAAGAAPPPPSGASGPAAPQAGKAGAAPAAATNDPYLAGAAETRDPVGTRLIDIATPFTLGERWLELLVTHRFIQPFNNGGNSHNLWGLDSGADVGIGFAYGVTRHLDFSVYRAEFQQDYELAAKYQLLQQAPGMPLSLALRGGADMIGLPGVQDPHRPFGQLLLARRLAPGWNLFVSPSWVHATPLLRDAYNVPVGLTAPLPGHWLIEAEGVPANRALRDTPGASQFAWHVAFTKPLGWHVFQILIGNSRATAVDEILGGDFGGGFAERDLRLGFNLIRYFNL